jgi:hypothetical protein
MQVSELNLNNLVRSGVVLLAALPLSLGVGNSLGTAGKVAAEAARPTRSQEIMNEVKGDLTRACLEFAVSKNDSKLERDAKTYIDEYFGGEVNYQALCNWVSS